jgi:L-ribulokinase
MGVYMALQKGENYVLGLDYGTDSCRTVIIDAANGEEAGVAVMEYPRWTKGLYCNASKNQFRQHPQDYIDVLEGTVKEAAAKAGKAAASKIRGIAIDTTGSTPCAADKTGMPLALNPEFSENPSAMFVLWKDHSAIAEAGLINKLARTWGGTDYTKFSGGVYSAEWFWAKLLRIISEDEKAAGAIVSGIEHCDWMTALLTGNRDIRTIKRSRCAMGHKAMWHAGFGGCPPADFWEKLDPRLARIRETLGSETYTSDTPGGTLSAEWADRLGIPRDIPVAIGAYDAHMGAVGGGVRTGWLVRVMGTSTCDMIVGPRPEGVEKPVRGICGQVDGSIIPGMIGYEAGQSSFGDVYAWFRNLLAWPLEAILPELEDVDAGTKEKIARTLRKKILPELEKAGEKIDPGDSNIVALDWLNGRRTPDANQQLKSAIMGLSLGSGAPGVYRALAEATAFGARAIVERFAEEGVVIDGIIGIGGVARKSPFVMQILADVLNRPISVAANDQCVALGAAIFAAVAAGLYPDIASAQKVLASPIEKTYTPRAKQAAVYNALYDRYKALGAFAGTQV